MNTTEEKKNCATRVLQYIEEHGSITQKQAADELGYYRLSAVVWVLKHKLGYPIRKQTETGLNRYGKTVSYARYYLVNDEEATA